MIALSKMALAGAAALVGVATPCLPCDPTATGPGALTAGSPGHIVVAPSPVQADTARAHLAVTTPEAFIARLEKLTGFRARLLDDPGARPEPSRSVPVMRENRPIRRSARARGVRPPAEPDLRCVRR